MVDVAGDRNVVLIIAFMGVKLPCLQTFALTGEDAVRSWSGEYLGHVRD